MLSRRPILSLGHSVGHLGAMGGPYKVVSYSFTPNCPMWVIPISEHCLEFMHKSKCLVDYPGGGMVVYQAGAVGFGYLGHL